MTRHTDAPLQIGFGLDELRAAVGNRLFTNVPVVAKLMDLDERTVRHGIERGEIPAVRVAQRYRIPVAALARLAQIAELEPEDVDLVISEAVSATDTATRSDTRHLKAIRHGNFDAHRG
jgi:excisionase family DNA binding protein